MIQTTEESYGRMWFHTVSCWHGRPRRAMYWCTCGRGRSLGVSTGIFVPYEDRLLPVLFPFASEWSQTAGGREERTEKGDMRNNHFWKRSPLTFPANNERHKRRQILALLRPRLVPSLSHSPLACSFSLWYTISNHYSVRTRWIQMAEATASCNSLTQMICS